MADWNDPKLKKEAERLFLEMIRAGAEPLKLLPIVRDIGDIAKSEQEQIEAIRRLHSRIVRSN